MSQQNPFIKKIDCVQLYVDDLDAGLAFYRDQLGHALIWRTSTAAGLRLQETDAEIVLQTDRKEPETDLLVESVETAVERFVQAGGRVTVAPFEIQIGKCAVVQDPWGNTLTLLDTSKGLLQTDAEGNVIGNQPAPTPSEGIAFIRANFVHLDLIAPLFDGYRQFYKKPSDLEGARQFLRDRLTNNESVIFLALRENVGLGFTQLYPSFSSVSMKRLWILNDLFVSPDVRKQGVAQGLMEHARQHALETGAKGLTLQTAVDNFTAQRLYESLGWIRETEFYSYDLVF